MIAMAMIDGLGRERKGSEGRLRGEESIDDVFDFLTFSFTFLHARRPKGQGRWAGSPSRVSSKSFAVQLNVAIHHVITNRSGLSASNNPKVTMHPNISAILI